MAYIHKATIQNISISNQVLNLFFLKIRFQIKMFIIALI